MQWKRVSFSFFIFIFFFIIQMQEFRMVKVAAANPFPTRHVRSLLRGTCAEHTSGAGVPSSTVPPPQTRQNRSVIKTQGSAQPRSRAIAQSQPQPHHRETLTKMGESEAIIEAQRKFRSEFLQVLRSRRRNQVPLTVEPGKPVKNPSINSSPPSPDAVEILNSCPKADIENLEDLLQEENLYLTIEEGDQGRLPLLILSLKENEKQRRRRRPAVVFLHSTNSYKESLRPLLEAYASRGYVAISVDSRYHGERASSNTTYRDALISAWKTGETMPFIYDTVWDLIKLADYLTQREDIDSSRIGITGISLGGMHAWFAAAADIRYAVVAPIIGVQGFRWAIDNDKWQARVNSIKPVFEVARDDLGKSDIDKEVVEKVWDRIAPGLASQFDSPFSIPSIAPRPLLILNGAEDPRCPLGGLEIPRSKAIQAYGELHSVDNFKFIAEPGIGHQITKFQVKESADWFDKFLKPTHITSKA